MKLYMEGEYIICNLDTAIVQQRKGSLSIVKFVGVVQ